MKRPPDSARVAGERARRYRSEMPKRHRLVALALLPALLACSALGVCWMTFAADAGHGCCEQATSTSLQAAPGPCASMAVAATVPVPVVHPPEAWVARPPAVAPRAERTALFARVLATKAPPLVLRI